MPDDTPLPPPITGPVTAIGPMSSPVHPARTKDWPSGQPVGHRRTVITIQRVRVRWSAAGRGASFANARRGLDGPVPLLVPLPTGDVVVHELLADEATGYARRDEVLVGGVERAREVGLWLSLDGAQLVVDRLPGSAAYPP